ncbi:MAG TPA: VWA domain-containing protein, partial [Acidobacteriaceae bacterium]|nr:VWA domain-containing protein [Acidobacteriaceae bacterium]
MRRALIALVLAASVSMLAQQIGENAPANSVPTLSVNSQLVIETVTVKDKNGNPIDGLTPKDFVLTENGVPQTIRSCEHQNLPPEKSVAPVPEPVPADLKVYYHLSPTQIRSEPHGTTLYRDRRLLAFYFDMTAL